MFRGYQAITLLSLARNCGDRGLQGRFGKIYRCPVRYVLPVLIIRVINVAELFVKDEMSERRTANIADTWF